MPVRGTPDHLYLGQSLSVAPLESGTHEAGNFAIKAAIRKAAEARFDFVVLPLAVPGGQGARCKFMPSVDSALVLDSKTWNSTVVGAVSDEIGSAGMLTNVSTTTSSLAGALAPGAEEKRDCLDTELRWAAHLGLPAVLLPPPQGGDFCGFARCINELLLGGVTDGNGDENGMALVVRTSPCSVGWTAWNRMRTLCNHHRKLFVALEFPESLADTERELQRWRGEPVRYAIIPSGIFVPNKQGYPVLPKKQKALLLDLLDFQTHVIFTGGSTEEVAARTSYVARLFQSRPAPSQADLFAQSHLDCLQAPLQPLADNLESQTYELFETDPVKYVKYEDALHEFIMERVAVGRAASLVVMVLGAGRGPLVAAALRAAARADVVISLWAVEKNPNAVHALRHRRRTEEAWRCVEVVAEDMRTWDAPRKADAIISELLGSFGDNELSPECLDAAQRVMAEDGVCIPQRYVSSLTPVSAARVWEDARSRGETADLELGYVIRLHRAFYPCTSIKDCFTFEHPNFSLASNERYVELEFEVEVDSLIHGFAGYFDCDLYGQAKMSIHPERFSEGMFSWFPIFFPLVTPVTVRKGGIIRCHWWRRVDTKKVWYEWALSEPIVTPVQNPGGRSYAIGL